MVTHPDSELIRRLLVGSGHGHKLADPANNAPGHISDRLGVTAPRTEPAPAAFPTPAAAAGALSDQLLAHAATITSQEQQKS